LGVERFHPGDKQWKLLLLAWAVVGGAVVAVDVVCGCVVVVAYGTGRARGYNHLVVWCRREQTCEAVKLREHRRIKVPMRWATTAWLGVMT
jgi:hypothetical protein